MLKEASTGRQEWIVEARLPAREIGFRKTVAGTVPTGMNDRKGDARRSGLNELYRYLASVLEERPVLLQAAGAVSITASASELDTIAKHPLVKRIQPNRRHLR